MDIAQRGSGSVECAPATKAPANGAAIEASLTLGELVEAVGSVTEDVTELVSVVVHVLYTRGATWAGPTSAGRRVAVAPCSPPDGWEPWPSSSAEVNA